MVEHIVSTYSRCGGLVDNLLSLHKEGVVVSWLNILSLHKEGVVVSWIIYCHYIEKVW